MFHSLTDAVSPLYNDTRYNDKICSDDNLTATKSFIEEVTAYQQFCKNIVLKTSRNIYFEYLLESLPWGDSDNYLKRMFCEEKRIKQSLSYTILLIKEIFKQEIHFNSNIFGNKRYHCNEGSLYLKDYPMKYIYLL